MTKFVALAVCFLSVLAVAQSLICYQCKEIYRINVSTDYRVERVTVSVWTQQC